VLIRSGKGGRPHRRTSREPGQGLTAAAISGVARALGSRPPFPLFIFWRRIPLSYTVLARRYRSSTFEDIVGQESIASTLKNAIESERTAHAYLFCGTRGVGKTSMARIFARELNRSEQLDQHIEIDNAILRGDDLDVIEIDGASNRGVQEARDLIAAANLSPTRCLYRIYIIDEVHMLTTPAFNALLKTMEEPPAHVKFILCTTEPHKVPATIQSRCQRFDFKTIPSSRIAHHLQYILDKEGITASPEITAEVARLGNGSMRDALSILDRLLAGGTTAIELDKMEDILGVPSHVAIGTLSLAISNRKMEEAFQTADSMLASGISLDKLLEVLATQYRNALIVKVCGSDTPIVELSDSQLAHVVSLSKMYDEATFSHFIALCDATSRQVRRGGSGRALFDATIARLCLADSLIEAGQVLAKATNSRSKNKKKSVIPKPIVETPIQQREHSGQPKTPPKDIDWPEIHRAIANNPGMKKIAEHLECTKLDSNKLSLTIKESGLESIQYILSQRQKIEQLLTKTFTTSYQVVIETNNTLPIDNQTTTGANPVEEDELVQAARGLFNGTVVNVYNKEKGDA